MQIPREVHVILVQGPCSDFRSVSRREADHQVRGRLLFVIRTFGRADEGSIVSPRTNTIGGLSGGRRGGDLSGAGSAPSFVVTRLRARALALDLA